MESVLRTEFRLVAERQKHLEKEVGQLGSRIATLAGRLEEVEQGEPVEESHSLQGLPEEKAAPADPPVIPARPKAVSEPAERTRGEGRWKKGEKSGGARLPQAPVGPALGRLQEGAAGLFPDGFELQLGRVWFVRVGVLLVLTGLVFLAHWAYTNFIVQWGPFMRSLVVFALSGTLAGLGLFLEKRSENLKKFGQVLGAGGMAGIFYGFYASHHVEALRWIVSPVVAGTLLILWTGVMAWAADRRRSELFAGLALLLTFYTVVVTPIALFTLVANLILALGALFFLYRRGWTGLSLAAMPLTYGAFGFWQLFYQNGNLGLAWPPDAGQFPLVALFLSAYWLVFTTAVLLPRRPLLGRNTGAAFAAVNNIGFFMLGALSIPEAGWDDFWLWPLSLGAVLVGLAAAARVRLPDRPDLARVYQAEGLVLVTAGLLIQFQGPDLALLLALESALLLVAARFHWGLWYKCWSLGIAGLATLAALGSVTPDDFSAGLTAFLVALVLLAQGLFTTDRRPAPDAGLRVFPALFGALSLVLLVAVTLGYALPGDRAALLGALALGLALPLRWHRFREIVLLSAPLMALALAGWAIREVEWFGTTADNGRTLVLLALVIGYGQFWLRQGVIALHAVAHHLAQALLAAAEVLLVLALVTPDPLSSQWFWLLPVLLLVTLAKANFLGSAWSAVFGDLYALLACALLYLPMVDELDMVEQPGWLPALGVVATFGLMQILGRAVKWPVFGTDSTPQSARVWAWWRRESVILGYPILTALAFVVWSFVYVEPAYRTLFFGMTALVLGLIGCVFQRKFAQGTAWTLGFLALIQFGWISLHDALSSMDLAGILALVALQVLTRRFAERDWGISVSRGLQTGVVSVAIVQILWFLTDRLTAADVDFALTMVWGMLGATLFALGLTVRDRLYRWWGLAVLALATGKLLFYDLWQLGTPGRILSCLALGVVMVVLGFLYNRFSEQLRRVL